MSHPVVDVLNIALPVSFGIYLLTVCVYLTAQTVLAERTRRADRREPDGAWLPSVDVIIPCYNEEPTVLAACLASVANQDYLGDITVHVVDDGSPNLSALEGVYDHYRDQPGFRILIMPENQGKRHAQVEALVSGRAEIIVAVDSDTTIAPDGIRRLVAGMADPRVGAAMGEMLAANAGTNWLTRLIDLRYWYACNQERAAQSNFGAVLCCSGPFSAYRRTVLESVLESYVNQTFWGRPSTNGEDRYLTNLILRAGKHTVYVGNAKAKTVVPEGMRSFLRQQVRWNRCTYRETLGILRDLPALGGYLALDVFAQLCAPFLLGLTILFTALQGFLAGSGEFVGWYAAGLCAVALIYCGYGIVRTRSLRFAAFALYGALHVALLIPIRLKAICTLTDDRWGERAVTYQPAAARR